MYVLKISMKQTLLEVRHYNYFQNALADIIDKGNIFDKIPDEIIRNLEDNPVMYCVSVDENKIADDFEFRYKNGLTIYVGQVLVEEDKSCK